MIRQAHTYLVSAMSGATLIAIAIAAFVMLVSAQVFRDWPLAALGGDDSASVSKAKPLGGEGVGAGGAAIAAHTVAPVGAGAATVADPRGAGRAGAAIGNRTPSDGAEVGSAGSAGSGESTSTGGGGGGAPATGGGSAQPTAPAQAPAAQGGGSGSNSSTATGSSGGSGNAPSGSTGSGGGTTTGGSGATTAGTTESTSAGLTETVNGTVGKVDESALGGTLDSTGVTGVTEGVVNGVAGPESIVGHAVDETVNTVGSLLGPKR